MAERTVNRLTTCRWPTYVGPLEFRTPSYFALAALIDGPLHGYAIVRRAAELSRRLGARLSTGTLYALLERAIGEGLVVAGEPYMEGGRPTARLHADARAGRAALAGRGGAARARGARGPAPAEGESAPAVAQ